jgi:hypothetical protein
MSRGPVISGHPWSWATSPVAKTITFCRYHHAHRSSHHSWLRSTAPEEGQSLPMTLSPVLMTDLWKLLGSGCLGDQ